MNPNILTVDIGGTAVKSALYHPDGEPVCTLPERPTRVSGHGNDIAGQLIELIREVQQQHSIAGVAIASAGVIDAEHGTVIYAGPTIPGYTGTALAAEVQRHCALPCSAENDVNAAALGESWLGAARGCRSAVCLTIGTGVGGAVILNGKLWHGEQFGAGEIGYLPCPDGRSFQDNASTTALLADYHRRSGEKTDGKTLFARAEAGDTHAREAISSMIDVLCTGLLPAVYLLAPEALIIGGGIAAQRHILEPQIQHALAARIQAERFLPRYIRCATLGNRAGMLGALRHFSDKYPTFNNGGTTP